MNNFLDEDNLGLITTKKVEAGEFNHGYCTGEIIESHSLSLKEINYLFPLYTYSTNGSQQSLMFDGQSKSQNIKWNSLPGWMATIQPYTSPATNNFVQVPEAIFYYIYAVLYSNIYRKKYQEFLKSDFPRIPFTSDYQTFQHLAELGEQLVEFHLLKSKMLDSPSTRYEGHGDDRVGKRDYHSEDKRLYINDNQYFDKVSPEAWNYFVGGYQVLDKWLKDRNGRTLTLEDQTHFRKVITALTQTIDIQIKIDKFYPKVEETLSK